MVRAFLGFEIPNHIGAQLVLQSRKLPVDRPQPPENYHVTLVFLGDQPRDLLEELDLALQRFASPPVPVQIAGLGLFGGSTPYNLHATIRPDSALMDLQARLERLCRREGLEPPRRKFTPHVTLAYLRTADVACSGLEQAVARNMSFAAEPFTPDAISLFRVHQGKRGNSYDVIAAYPLSNM